MTQVVVIIVRALPELLITIEGPDISTIQIFSFPIPFKNGVHGHLQAQ